MSGSASEQPAFTGMRSNGPKQPTGPPPRHVLKVQMDKAAEAASLKADLKKFERANKLQPSTVHAFEQLPLEYRQKVMLEAGSSSSDSAVYAMIKTWESICKAPGNMPSTVGSAISGSTPSGWPLIMPRKTGKVVPPRVLPGAESAQQVISSRVSNNTPGFIREIHRDLPVEQSAQMETDAHGVLPLEEAAQTVARCLHGNPMSGAQDSANVATTSPNGQVHSATSTPGSRLDTSNKGGWRSTLSMLSGQEAKKTDEPLRNVSTTSSARSSSSRLRPLQPEEACMGSTEPRQDLQDEVQRPPPPPPLHPHMPGYHPWMAWHTWHMMAAMSHMKRDGSGRDKKEKKDKKDKKERKDKNDDKEKLSRGGSTAKRASGTSRERSRKRHRHRDVSSSSSAKSSSSRAALATRPKAGRPMPVNAAPVPKAKASSTPSHLAARVKDLEAKVSVQQEVPVMASTPLAGCLVSTPLSGCLAQAGDALIGPQVEVTEVEMQGNAPLQEVTHPATQAQQASEAASRSSAEQKLHDWLLNLDGGRGSLLQFFDVLRNEFDADFNQIGAVRLPEPSEGVLGTIDPSFWEVCGVERMGHRLLLARGISMLPDPKN